MTSGPNPSLFSPESSVAVLAPVLLRRTRPIYQVKRGRPERELAALGVSPGALARILEGLEVGS